MADTQANEKTESLFDSMLNKGESLLRDAAKATGSAMQKTGEFMSEQAQKAQEKRESPAPIEELQGKPVSQIKPLLPEIEQTVSKVSPPESSSTSLFAKISESIKDSFSLTSEKFKNLASSSENSMDKAAAGLAQLFSTQATPVEKAPNETDFTQTGVRTNHLIAKAHQDLAQSEAYEKIIQIAASTDGVITKEQIESAIKNSPPVQTADGIAPVAEVAQASFDLLSEKQRKDQERVEEGIKRDGDQAIVLPAGNDVTLPGQGVVIARSVIEDAQNQMGVNLEELRSENNGTLKIVTVDASNPAQNKEVEYTSSVDAGIALAFLLESAKQNDQAVALTQAEGSLIAISAKEQDLEKIVPQLDQLLELRNQLQKTQEDTLFSSKSDMPEYIVEAVRTTINEFAKENGSDQITTSREALVVAEALLDRKEDVRVAIPLEGKDQSTMEGWAVLERDDLASRVFSQVEKTLIAEAQKETERTAQAEKQLELGSREMS